MFPGASHSVWLFWEGSGADRRFVRYFVNLEAPFVRTAAGFETQDHTLDIAIAGGTHPEGQRVIDSAPGLASAFAVVTVSRG